MRKQKSGRKFNQGTDFKDTDKTGNTDYGVVISGNSI